MCLSYLPACLQWGPHDRGHAMRSRVINFFDLILIAPMIERSVSMYTTYVTACKHWFFLEGGGAGAGEDLYICALRHILRVLRIFSLTRPFTANLHSELSTANHLARIEQAKDLVKVLKVTNSFTRSIGAEWLAVPNRPLHGFRRHLGCGQSRQKLLQMYGILFNFHSLTPLL